MKRFFITLSFAAAFALLAQLMVPGISVNRANAQTGTGTVTVTKVVNGGGPNVAADFQLFLNGVPIQSGVATTTLNAGVFVVSEANLPGYTSAFSGDCSASGQITLAAGATANCTITNTFVGTTTATSTLTINKVVVGSTRTAAEFPLFLNGMPITGGVATTVPAGTFAVTETNLTGFVGTFSGACNALGQVTLAAGANATCTLTNFFVGTTTSNVLPGQVLGAQFAQTQTPGLPQTGGGPDTTGTNRLAEIAFMVFGSLAVVSGAGFLLLPKSKNTF